MSLLFWVCLSLCSLLSFAQNSRCPQNINGCSCNSRNDVNNTIKTIVRCDGFDGSASQFKDNLQSLVNYEVDELIINNYRTSSLPEEPFTNTVIRKIMITNSWSLRSFGSDHSSKTFFENIGHTLESLILINVPRIRSTQWRKISASLQTGSGPDLPSTPEAIGSSTDSSNSSTEQTITSSEPNNTSTDSTITPSEPNINSTETTITSSEPNNTSTDSTITPSEPNINSTETTSTGSEADSNSTVPTITSSEPNETSTESTVTSVEPNNTSTDSTMTSEEPNSTLTESTLTSVKPNTTSSSNMTESTDTETENTTETQASETNITTELSSDVPTVSSSSLPNSSQNYDNTFNLRSLLSIDELGSFKINSRASVPALKVLILKNNDDDSTFEDLSVFAPMTNLKIVVMQGIGLTGAFRADLSIFPSLQTLDLSENRILLFDPKSIPKSLKTIDLSDNSIIKFEQTFLETLTDPDYSSIQINVESNSLNCQCDYIKIIVEELQDVFEGTCAAPPPMEDKPFGKGGCYQTYSFLPTFHFPYFI